MNSSAYRDPPFTRYTIAVAVVVAATLLRWGLSPLLGVQAPLTAFVPWVALAAWRGGVGPGLVATALSAFAGWWFFVRQLGVAPLSAAEITRVLLFLVNGVVISAIAEAMHRARARVERHGQAIALQAEALERSGERQRTALEAGQLGAFTFDLLSRQVFGDERAREVMKLPGVVPLEEVFDRVHPDDRYEVRAALERAAQTAEPTGIEFRVVLPEGATRWLSVFGQGEWEGERSGRPAERVVGVVRDITARKERDLRLAEAAAEVTRSHAFLKSVFDAQTDCVKVLDLAGRLLWMNDCGQQLMEIAEPDTVRGADWLAFWKDDAPAQALAREAIAAARAGRVGSFRAACPTQRGLVKWWDVRISPIPGADGKPERLLSVSRDISAMRAAEHALERSEQRWRDLANAMPQLVWTCEADGPCDFLSRQWCDYTGIPEGPQLGSGWLEALHPEDRAPLMRAWMAAVESGGALDVEFRIRRHDGAYRWFKTRAVAIRDAAGKIVKWYGSNTDIEDLYRHAEELRTAKEAAEQASRAKDDFLAALSHELRNPLNPVLLLATEAARDPALAPEARADWAMVQRNIALEARLIDDLLDFTRLGRGKLRLEARELDAHEVLRDAIETVRGEIARKNIALEVALAARPSRVQGDAVRLQQVFWNLLNNAVKFTPEGGAIRLRTEVRASAALAIEVADTGHGLTAEELARAFQPFVQGEHAAGRAGKSFDGLGLGLAITRELVALHGGELSARSEGRDRGATFRIELPLA